MIVEINDGVIFVGGRDCAVAVLRLVDAITDGIETQHKPPRKKWRAEARHLINHDLPTGFLAPARAACVAAKAAAGAGLLGTRLVDG